MGLEGMSDSNSPKALSELIRQQVNDLLHANDVYSLDSYGWLNADDVDPELVGHAMWQTDSLSFRLLDTRMAASDSKIAPFPELASWQRFLISAGGDFEGLMDAARLSIGLALFQREAGDLGRFGEESPFQLHLIAALVTLGAASDRLRDVFIAAIFREETKPYERGTWKVKGDKRLYVTPFEEAVGQISAASESVLKLPALANEIGSFRKTRNAVVHDLATETGRVHAEIASLPRPPTYREAMEMAYAKAAEKGIKFEDEHAKRIADQLNLSIEWYKLLVEASNHVFIVENTIRRERGQFSR
jgi:hypothetical protein